MKTCTLIRIWYREEKQASPLSGLYGYGYYFQGLAEQFGGRCLAHLKDGILTIALQGVPKAEVDRRLEDILRLAMQRGELVQLSKQDGAPTPIELPEQFLQPGAMVRKVLTKKLLFLLPEGAYVASNTFISPAEKAERDDSPEEVWGKVGSSIHQRTPSWAERLSGLRTREAAWQRAAAAEANGRLCIVFWSDKEFNEFCSSCPPSGAE